MGKRLGLDMLARIVSQTGDEVDQNQVLQVPGERLRVHHVLAAPQLRDGVDTRAEFRQRLGRGCAKGQGMNPCPDGEEQPVCFGRGPYSGVAWLPSRFLLGRDGLIAARRVRDPEGRWLWLTVRSWART